MGLIVYLLFGILATYVICKLEKDKADGSDIVCMLFVWPVIVVFFIIKSIRKLKFWKKDFFNFRDEEE